MNSEKMNMVSSVLEVIIEDCCWLDLAHKNVFLCLHFLVKSSSDVCFEDFVFTLKDVCSSTLPACDDFVERAFDGFFSRLSVSSGVSASRTFVAAPDNFFPLRDELSDDFSDDLIFFSFLSAGLP
jgi:hypothetical protein